MNFKQIERCRMRSNLSDADTEAVTKESVCIGEVSVLQRLLR